MCILRPVEHLKKKNLSPHATRRRSTDCRPNASPFLYTTSGCSWICAYTVAVYAVVGRSPPTVRTLPDTIGTRVWIRGIASFSVHLSTGAYTVDLSKYAIRLTNYLYLHAARQCATVCHTHSSLGVYATAIGPMYAHRLLLSVRHRYFRL